MGRRGLGLHWSLFLGLSLFQVLGCDVPLGQEEDGVGEETVEVSDLDAVAEVADVVPESESDGEAWVAVQALFDLGAARTVSGGFYDYPFPSDLRVNAAGCPEMSGFIAPRSDLVQSVLSLVGSERRGFSPQGAVYFRFDGGLDVATLPATAGEAREAGSLVQLINIEEGGKAFGERLPVYVGFVGGRSTFWRSHTLVMRTVPGVGMRPGERYAAVLKMGLLGENGLEVVRDPRFTSLLAGEGEAEEVAHLAEVVGVLARLGIDAESLLSVSAFTTSDVAQEMDALRVAVQGCCGVVEGSWTLAATHAGYRVFTGEFTSLDFMSGVPPYMQPMGSGRLLFDGEGAPLGGREVAVRFTVTVPTSPMPAGGYPLVVYGHGTGGSANTHARDNAEGVWLATEGLATLGFDAALHGTRVDGAVDVEMLLGVNPVAARDSVRQTVVDMMVIYDIMRRSGFVIGGEVSGGEEIRFSWDPGLYMGHSQGSQEAGLLLGVEGSIDAAFLSAGGGGATLSIVQRKHEGMEIACLIALVLGVNCEELTMDSPVLTLVVQPLMDPADPLNYAHRFIREPPPGMRPKHIAMSEGMRDTATPPDTQEALAAAIGLALVEPVARRSEPLVLMESPVVETPVFGNIATPWGAVTGGLLQWPGLGHFAIYDRADPRYRYVQFMRSAAEGQATIVGPQ